MQLKIDPEFEAYQPGTPAETDAQLEASIKAEGIRDKIKVWKGHDLIVDGHRRFRACQRIGVAVEDKDVQHLEFADRLAVKVWMDRWAASRRNLSPKDQAMVAARLARNEMEASGGKRGATKAAVTATASATGRSERTVWRDKAYAEAVERLTPKQREKVEAVKHSMEDVVALSKLPDKERDKALKASKDRLVLPAAPRKPSTRPVEDLFAEGQRHLGEVLKVVQKIYEQKEDFARCKVVQKRVTDASEILDKWAKA